MWVCAAGFVFEIPMSDIQWHLTEYDADMAEKLAKELDLSPVVARLLIARGITTPEEAGEFLNPTLDSLHDPLLLPDMNVAVERLKHALEAGEKIMIHGDYDVDGVTSAALLIRVLRALGGDVIYRLPHRQTEGYDIKASAVDEAKEADVSLIVTSDCGVTAIETAERAKELGIDLIITDHHEPGLNLPFALAVINPKRADSNYPFPHLAGVGVAYKLAEALVRDIGHNVDRFRDRFLDLVALGTVADVSPLIGENRVMVKFGMQSLAKSKKVGLQAILRRCKLEEKELVAYHLSHIIGPRINSVGRLDTAEIALGLMLTIDEAEAERLAEVLERTNSERQAEQSKILEEAEKRIAELDLEIERVLVLCAPGWNTGVVGIVASKLVEQYGRPAILLSQDVESGVCVGSARSIKRFNLIDALRSCGSLLDRCGGHAYAAGLCLKGVNLPGFTERLKELAGEIVRPEDMIPSISVDAVLVPSDFNLALVRQIAALEPFGHGNPEPVFITSGLEVIGKQRVGADGSHLKMRLRGDGSSQTDCIGFGMGKLEEVLHVGKEIDICYNIRVNRYREYDNIQLVAKDLRESTG